MPLERLKRTYLGLLIGAIIIHVAWGLAVAFRLGPALGKLETVRHAGAITICVLWVQIALSLAMSERRSDSWPGNNHLGTFLTMAAASCVLGILRLPGNAWTTLSLITTCALWGMVFPPKVVLPVFGVMGFIFVSVYAADGFLPGIIMCISSLIILYTALFLIKGLLSDWNEQSVLFDQARWAAAKLSSLSLRLDSTIRQTRYRSCIVERKRLAQVIHDSVGYSLTAILVQLHALKGEISNDAADARIDMLEGLVRKTLSDTRRQVSEMRNLPEEPDEGDWGQKIMHLCEVFVDCTGIRVNTNLSDIDMIPNDIAETLYRVIQEGLTNSYRHGRSTLVEISTRWRRDLGMLLMKISDNGIGCASVKSGNGLSGMDERIMSLGGSLVIHSTLGKGFNLGVDIPLKRMENGTCKVVGG